jgi:AcrR family transcriptional regulator
VEASGTNLASIGYHYGTKEALLNAALMEALEEWAQELKGALAGMGDLPGDSIGRFQQAWTRVIELFERHRPVWAAQFDAISQLDHVPEVRSFFVEAQRQAQKGLVELLLQGEDLPPHTEAAVGRFYHALLGGVMMQWAVDPEHASTGESLAEALRTVMEDARGCGSGLAV